MEESPGVKVPIPESIPDPPRRSLKRSASLASLPTPPRTHHKHKGKKSRTSSRQGSESAQESDSEASGLGEAGYEAVEASKRRRIDSKGGEEDEDAFWLGPAKSSSKLEGTLQVSSVPAPQKHADVAQSSNQEISTARKLKATDDQPTKIPPSPSHRRRTDAVTLPVSPPPSRRTPRKRRLVATPKRANKLPRLASPPRTPTRSTADDTKYPIRDSPDNPFLDSPIVDKDDLVESSPGPSTRVDADFEKATVTYVFRGVKAKFPNPYYNPATGRARTPPPNSRLPIEHPDYSPDLRCPPKLLFPKRTRGKKAPSTLKKAGTSAGPVSDSEDDGKASARKSNGESSRKDGGSLLDRLKAKRALSPFGESDDEGDDEDFSLGPIKPIQLKLESAKSSSEKKGKAVRSRAPLLEDESDPFATKAEKPNKAKPQIPTKLPVKESPLPQRTRSSPRLLARATKLAAQGSPS